MSASYFLKCAVVSIICCICDHWCHRNLTSLADTNLYIEAIIQHCKSSMLDLSKFSQTPQVIVDLERIHRMVAQCVASKSEEPDNNDLRYLALEVMVNVKPALEWIRSVSRTNERFGPPISLATFFSLPLPISALFVVTNLLICTLSCNAAY